jgi:hypothetical protein
MAVDLVTGFSTSIAVALPMVRTPPAFAGADD